MSLSVKNAYEPSAPNDGHRFLVDRLWPRGISKGEIAIEEWLKEIAPSDQLRKSTHSGELTWSAFRKEYITELKQHRDELRRLVKLAEDEQVTLIFSAHDRERNNAVVLMQYLKMLGAH